MKATQEGQQALAGAAENPVADLPAGAEEPDEAFLVNGSTSGGLAPRLVMRNRVASARPAAVGTAPAADPAASRTEPGPAVSRVWACHRECRARRPKPRTGRIRRERD